MTDISPINISLLLVIDRTRYLKLYTKLTKLPELPDELDQMR